MATYEIAVLPGDGIGEEIMPLCTRVLQRVEDRVGGFDLEFEEYVAGAGCFQETGIALPENTVAASASADAILLGAMGLPDIRYPDGTEIIPQIELRIVLDLYAGVRPVRPYPGLPLPLRNQEDRLIDFVIIRESTEGLFDSIGKGRVEGDREATDSMKITRRTCERLFDFAFELTRTRKSQGRPGRLTCVDKANVFKSLAFFRKIFDERAAGFGDVEIDHLYVDAAAMKMVTQPWSFDVMVMENMFGDILSDLGAGLMGGMGMAPSADIGDKNAVFQPCHGTAPDIAGKGIANPTAMYLSGAMMLLWLGREKGDEACTRAGELLNRAVDRVYSNGELIPIEIGGGSGTRDIHRAVMAAVDELSS